MAKNLWQNFEGIYFTSSPPEFVELDQLKQSKVQSTKKVFDMLI